MVFFKCFKSNTITILAKEGDSQDKGTTLKLCAPLTGPKALTLPTKDSSMHIESWSSEVSRDVTAFRQPSIEKNVCLSDILILNHSHHARDSSPALLELLGDRIRNGAVTWSGTLSTTGEATFIEFYWEWLEDVLSRSKGVLTRVGLYHAVYASLFSYDRHPSVLRAFFEHWCPATNTLHTSQGEMSISLWDLHKIGGLPIQGRFYDEVVPSTEEFSHRNSRGLPASCRYLFWAYHKLSQESQSKSGVKISSWIRFWYWEAMRYKRPSKKSGRNKTTMPKGNSDPSGIIGPAGRRTSDELRAFEGLGIKSEHLEESYLAAFLACWLCKFVFPKGDVNFIRPGVFKVASKMAAGESFSLAIPVLASIYNGLSAISISASTEDRAVVLPYHYVYGWLGEYFGTHFSMSTLGKLGPLMARYSGVLSAKSLDDSQVQATYQSYEGLRMDHLARVGSARRRIVDDSYLCFSDLSYLISLRSGYVSLRQGDRCIVQPYSPHRFSRQFGFVQHVPGKLKEDAPSESLQAVYMCWESCSRARTNASIILPAKDEFKNNPVTRAYVNWWSKVYYESLGMASGTNSSRSRSDAPREGCSVVPAQPGPLDCASSAPQRDKPMVPAPPRPHLPPQNLDACEEAGDEADSCGDGLVSRHCPQLMNKRPLEGAYADRDVNFRHKKKERLRPPQFDGRVSPEKEVEPSCSFNLANADDGSYIDMLLGVDLPTAGEIGDPPGAELVSNLQDYPNLPCEGMQELVVRPTPLPAGSEVSLRGPNLPGTEQLIHRIRLRAAMDVKSHIEERISKCPWEDLTLLKEDLSKLVSAIDHLNVDSSPLRAQIAELMVASTEYSSLRAFSSKKLSLEARAQQLAATDSSIAEVYFFQQADLEDYQATEASLASVQLRLEALKREREQLEIEASRLQGVLSEQEATNSQHEKEMSRLEQEKRMVIELPTLSSADVETLKTLEDLLKDHFRSFRDMTLE